MSKVIVVLPVAWMKKMLATAQGHKLDEIEVAIIDGVPYSKMEDGKVVAGQPGKKVVPKKEKKTDKKDDDKGADDKYPVWRVDEKLVKEGKGKPEFNIADLDEANAITIGNELGLDMQGKDLPSMKKEIWTAIYGG